MKTVAFITIRLNSKRLPNKNILPLMGKPLCWHVTKTMCQVKTIDEVYVYCSDESVRQYIPEEAIFLQRDKWLDGDEVKAKDTYSAFTNDVDADIYVAACTTSPFTVPATVEHALGQVLDHGYDSAFSARRIQTFCWYDGKPINYDLTNIPRTQDMKPVFEETSGFFIFKKNIWKEHRRRIGFNPYIQEVDSVEGIDIDTMEDYELAKLVAKGMNR